MARPIRSVAQIYTPTEPLLESKVVTQHVGLGGDRMPMDTSKIQWLIIIFPVIWWLFGGIPPIPHFQPHLTQYLLTILSWWRAAQVFALLAAASANLNQWVSKWCSKSDGWVKCWRWFDNPMCVMSFIVQHTIIGALVLHSWAPKAK